MPVLPTILSFNNGVFLSSLLLVLYSIVLPVQCIIRVNNLSESGSVEQDVGSRFELVCTNEKFSVKWILTNNKKYRDWSNPLLDARATIAPYVNGITILTIVGLKYTDTGSYACAPTDPNVQDKPVSTYLFVRDPVPSHTFLHWVLSVPQTVIANQDSYIGCLVTDQTADVRLFISSRREDKYSYDPRRGFFVPANNMESGSSQASCRAYRSENDADDDFIDHLNFPLVIIDIVQPETIDMELDSSGAEHAYATSCMHLDCILRDLKQTFAAHCNWTLPDSTIRGRCNETANLDTGYKSTLQVCDLKTSDTGTYKCTCAYYNFQDTKSAYVTVSPTKGQVRVIELKPTNPLVVSGVGESVKLSVKYESWPEDSPEFNIRQLAKWHHVYTSPLDGDIDDGINDQDQRYVVKHEIYPTDDSSVRQKTETLEIKNLSVEDSGKYLLVIQVKDLTEIINFTLTVNARTPVLTSFVSNATDVHAHYDPNFLQLASPFQYICLASMMNLGSNDLKIEWCRFGRQENCLPVMPQTKLGTFQIAKIAHLDASYLQVDNGAFSCRSVSYDQSKPLHVYVTDVPNAQKSKGINIITRHIPAVQDGHTNVLYEGDGYELSCQYQKYYYSFVGWHWKDYEGHTVEINAQYSVGQYSSIHKISFQNMEPIESGEYVCSATNATGQYTLRSHELRVTPIKLPTFSESTFEQREYEANYSQPFSMFCSASGVPQPQIQWFKDGAELKPRAGLYISSDKQNVTLVTTVKEDAGSYSCHVYNRAGQASRNMTLTVAGLKEGGMSGVSKAIVIVVSTAFALVVVGLLIALIVIYRREKKKDAQLLVLYNSLRMSKRFTNEDPRIRRKRRNMEGTVPLPLKFDPKRPLNNQIDILGYDRQYEIERNFVNLEEIIGEGQFGKIYRGSVTLPDPNIPTWKKRISGISGTGMLPPKPVAVKVPKDGRNAHHQKALLDELKIMVHLGSHPNVLGLVAAVTKLITKGELYVVVDLCERGSLLDFLRAHRSTFVTEIVGTEPLPAVTNDGYLAPTNMANTSVQHKTVYQGEIQEEWEAELYSSRLTRNFIATCDLLSWAYQIANGMHFLASNYLIHRDLAARNCLLTDNLVVKIADFGLARQNEQYHIDGSRHVPLPIKWMALESIVDYDYTVKSDVWSFGVLIWELFSLGEVPYPTQPLDQSFIDYLKRGNRLDQPVHAPDEIYSLMSQCWSEQPEDRPAFHNLITLIENELCKVSALMKEWTLNECHTKRHSYVNVVNNNLNALQEGYGSGYEMSDLGAIQNDVYINRRGSHSEIPNTDYV